MKVWVCSGEPLAPSLALQFFRSFRQGGNILYNFYGSTEMMGDVTYHIMKSAEDITVDNKVPIGRENNKYVISAISSEI